MIKGIKIVLMRNIKITWYNLSMPVIDQTGFGVHVGNVCLTGRMDNKHNSGKNLGL